MTNILIRFFIKDYKSIQSASVRKNYGFLVSITGIMLNVLLFTGKLLLGVLTKSISITADAINNLGDAGSSIITLIGFKISGKPADNEHPYGHGRIEYVSGFLVAMAIFLMGVELGKSSIKKFFSPVEVEFSKLTILILVVSILIKLWMALFNRKVGKLIGSSAITATAQDSLNDCISTGMVLAGLVFYHFTDINIDAYIGLMVSIFILFSGFITAKATLNQLLGEPPNKELVNDVYKTVLSHEGIIGAHDLLIHNYGPDQTILSIHAEVPNTLDVVQIHDIIDHIEVELKSKFNCSAVIHMDPVPVDNPMIKFMKSELNRILAEISESLSIHDLRISERGKRSSLSFDLLVPYDFHISDEDLINIITDRIYTLTPVYIVDIKIDKGHGVE